MRKLYSYFFLLVTVSFSACKDFEELQLDPNRTTQATPDLLLTNIETTAFNRIDLSAALASRYLVFTDGVSLNQYYGWQRASYETYNNLRQVVKLEEEATRLQRPVYLALAKFFRSYYILDLTQTFGDVPYSEALAGSAGAFTPVYDKQEDIYLRVLTDLQEANTLLTSNQGTIAGDVVYQGDITKWKKLVNSLTLRVLMSLSKKENNAQLRVKQRFQEIVSNPGQYPIFTSNADNAQLTFYDLADNRYPTYNSNDLQTAYYLDESFVKLLQGYGDPRLFTMADPAPQHTNLPETNVNAYAGVKGSDPLDVNARRVVAGEASKIDARYYNNPVNEPSVAIGYPEVQFILAEAVVRGWIDADANVFYKNGIEASMQFYKVEQAAITTYLAQPDLQLTPGDELAAILTQKYIAYFLNSGWQSFYEQRRTGLPGFDVSGTGVLNQGQIPKRWMYPENEFDLNQTNAEAAIARQYPEGDNINGTMWLLKQE